LQPLPAAIANNLDIYLTYRSCRAMGVPDHLRSTIAIFHRSSGYMTHRLSVTGPYVYHCNAKISFISAVASWSPGLLNVGSAATGAIQARASGAWGRAKRTIHYNLSTSDLHFGHLKCISQKVSLILPSMLRCRSLVRRSAGAKPRLQLVNLVQLQGNTTSPCRTLSKQYCDRPVSNLYL
jgi:hypothetical protein